MAAVVKYEKSAYKNKIAKLEGYLSMLESNYQTLDGLRGQVRSFWNDPQTAYYLKELNNTIIGVRNSMDMTQRVLLEYKGIVENMGKTEAVSDDLLSDITTVISGLGIRGAE